MQDHVSHYHQVIQHLTDTESFTNETREYDVQTALIQRIHRQENQDWTLCMTLDSLISLGIILIAFVMGMSALICERTRK